MKMRMLLCTAALAVGACERTVERAGWDGLSTDPAASGDVTLPQVRTTTFEAGAATPRPAMRNPFADAADEGERFYVAFNCAGCHGARGGGGIGPPLARESLIYGNDPQNIFQSIVQGRPYGMPAFGGKAPDDVIWKIAAYVRHLSAPGSPDPEATASREGDVEAAQ
jgi:cytochrome c oxidase cbb3-type subunit III